MRQPGRPEPRPGRVWRSTIGCRSLPMSRQLSRVHMQFTRPMGPGWTGRGVFGQHRAPSAAPRWLRQRGGADGRDPPVLRRREPALASSPGPRTPTRFLPSSSVNHLSSGPLRQFIVRSSPGRVHPNQVMRPSCRRGWILLGLPHRERTGGQMPWCRSSMSWERPFGRVAGTGRERRAGFPGW